MTELSLAFYGDDLTGSTDSMEALVLGGSRKRTVGTPPSKTQLDRFPGLGAVGLIGFSRTMTRGPKLATHRLWKLWRQT
jgi:uncharacterized protein YgbK (DUF1537 family)